MRINSIVSSNQNFKGIKITNPETKEVLKKRMNTMINPSGYTLVFTDNLDDSQVIPVGQELEKMEGYAKELDTEGDLYIAKMGDKFFVQNSKATILAEIDDEYERGHKMKTSSILEKLNNELAKSEIYIKAVKRINDFFA